MKSGICLLFALFANTILAQETPRIVINGKIHANSMDLEGIYVINLKTEKSTVTEKEGNFSIAAISGDTLLFSSIHLRELRLVLKPEDFQKESYIVKMELTITPLNEVVVKRYDNINAVSLGISPSGMIHRTQAERKLYTAKSTTGDAILNLISGRTAMLKKEVEVEKKWSYMQLIDNMFDQNHFVSILKIPLEYVKGFKYYAIENDKFTTILKTNNRITTEFLLGELATKYIKIIDSENE